MPFSDMAQQQSRTRAKKTADSAAVQEFRVRFTKVWKRGVYIIIMIKKVTFFITLDIIVAIRVVFHLIIRFFER